MFSLAPIQRDSYWETRRRFAARFSIHLPPVDRGTLIDWGRHYLPHYYTCEPSMMHRWISKTIDRKLRKRGRRVAIIGPRGGAKSTTATVTYVLKQAVEGREPYMMIVSDTEGQAVEHLTNIKAELEDNEHGLLADYPFATGIGPKWKENYIRLNNGVLIHAAGTGSKIRGRRLRQHRPSLIILDDPENDGHIESSTQREKVLRWFNRTLMNMGDQRTNVLVLGSAMHRESLVFKLRTRPGYLTRRINGEVVPFRAIEKWPKRMDLWDKWERIFNNPTNPNAEKDAARFYRRNRKAMNRGAKLLWPDRESLYALMVLRAEIGAAAFDAEKQGNPIDPSTCEWPESYFTHAKFWFDEWPTDLVVRGMSLDPSKGKKDKRHDYSAFAMGGIGSDGVVYVDCDLDKRPVNQIVTDGVDLYESFRPDVLAIETNSFQELLAEDFEDEFTQRDINYRMVGVENYKPAKIVRIRRLSSLLAQRRIRFKSNSKGATLCVQQLKDFPNGDHDDGPDSVEMVCRVMLQMLEGDDAAPDQLIRYLSGMAA